MQRIEDKTTENILAENQAVMASMARDELIALNKRMWSMKAQRPTRP